MRRALLVAVVLLAPFLLSSCGFMFQRTVYRADVTFASPTAPDNFTRFATAKGQNIVGYTTTDGRYNRVNTYARLEGDSLRFKGWNPDFPCSKTPWRVAVADLQSVRSVHVPVWYYVVLGVVSPVVVGAIVLGISEAVAGAP